MQHSKFRSLLKPFLTLLAILTLSTDSGLVRAQSTDWQLIFSDEFNLPNGSRPDPQKWNQHPRYAGTWSRWITDSKDVSFIKNGCLVLRAIPNRIEKTDTATMFTGAINTKGKFDFKYGRVELRMKSNNLRGNFAAIWMKKTSEFTTKEYGEIDIFEAAGDRRLAQQTVHSKLTMNLKGHKEKNTHFEDVDLSRWHIYGLEWSPTHLVWTIDGRTVFHYAKSNRASQLSQGQWTFDEPFFLILNQSVGDGTWECMKPQTNKVYETRIDWVRVYQKRQE